MRTYALLLTALLLVTLIWGEYISPVDDAREIVSVYGEVRLSQDLSGLNYLLGLGISTFRRNSPAVKCMRAGYLKRIIKNDPFYGTAVFINHEDNTQSRYIGLFRLVGTYTKLFDALSVEFGDSPFYVEFSENEYPLEQGQIIGYSGTSGFSDIPSCYIEIIELSSQVALNPINLIDFNLSDKGYQILFKKIRINNLEYEFTQGAVYPFTGNKPMIDILIENTSPKSEFKFALQEISVKMDNEEVLSINMDRIPVELEESAGRIYAEKTNHQTFWYRLTTPWTSPPVYKNEIRKIEAFNDRIKVEVTAKDCFGTIQTAEFSLKRR